VWFVIWRSTGSGFKTAVPYAQNIGLAFQIVDDILDITATQELGKQLGRICKRKSDLSQLWGWKNPSVAQQLIEAASAN